MTTTTLHVLRHADYSQIGRTLAGRTPGYGLSDQGRAQVSALATRLADEPIAAVYASPVQRAMETATPIAERLGLFVTTEPGLEEIDFGTWMGAAFDELRTREGWGTWNRFRSQAAAPGGEAIIDVQARAIGAVRRARAAHRGQAIVLVSHADVVKTILLHFLGMPLDLMRRIDVAPASRSVIALDDEDAKVLSINLPPGA